MEDMTTRWINVKGRAEFLKRVEERKNCEDIKGEVLTEAQRYAYAICEELDSKTEIKVREDVVAGRPLTYKLSGDKLGLLCYYKPDAFYYIHSDELTEREKEIHQQLLDNL